MPYLLVIDKCTGLRGSTYLGVAAECYVVVSARVGGFKEKTIAVKSYNPAYNTAFFLPDSAGSEVFIEVYYHKESFGVVRVDLAAECVRGEGNWVKSALALTGTGAKGTVSFQAKPYVESSVTVASAKGLYNADWSIVDSSNKSDPFVRLRGVVAPNVQIGVTRTIRNDLNPTWNETFPLSLHNLFPRGGKLSPLLVTVWDEDDKKQGSRDSPLGWREVGWTHVFPDGHHVSIDLPLTGKGAIPGAKVALTFTNAPPAAAAADPIIVEGTVVYDDTPLEYGLDGPAAPGGPEDHPQGGESPAVDAGGGFSLPPVPPGPLKIVLYEENVNRVVKPGFGVKLADCSDSVADKYAVGLSWEMGAAPIDLDASCLLLGAGMFPVGQPVSFRNLTAADGSMRHLGDHRSGSSAGAAKADNETIQFDLERVSPEIKYLCFTINSPKGIPLNTVESAVCRLYNSETGKSMCEFKIGKDKLMGMGAHTALMFCVIYRVGESDWYMHNVDKGASGSHVMDTHADWLAFLERTPLVTMHTEQPSRTARMGKVKVPESLGPKGLIVVKTHAGCEQELQVPPGTAPGTVLEFTVTEMYTA
jgi:tellurium resistance protein TerZ